MNEAKEKAVRARAADGVLWFQNGVTPRDVVAVLDERDAARSALNIAIAERDRALADRDRLQALVTRGTKAPGVPDDDGFALCTRCEKLRTRKPGFVCMACTGEISMGVPWPPRAPGLPGVATGERFENDDPHSGGPVS